jgi:hypothetical protein
MSDQKGGPETRRENNRQGSRPRDHTETNVETTSEDQRPYKMIRPQTGEKETRQEDEKPDRRTTGTEKEDLRPDRSARGQIGGPLQRTDRKIRCYTTQRSKV